MAVRVTCPHCHKELRLPAELYDASAQCPLCRGGFAIVWRQRAATPPKTAPVPVVVSSHEPAALRPCGHCGEMIKLVAKRCPHCGKGQEA